MAKDSGMQAGSQNKGLKNNSPSSSDASTKLKMSPTVDSGATRGGSIADTPATLGPRTA
jgi:hypothetical protein